MFRYAYTGDIVQLLKCMTCCKTNIDIFPIWSSTCGYQLILLTLLLPPSLNNERWISQSPLTTPHLRCSSNIYIYVLPIYVSLFHCLQYILSLTGKASWSTVFLFLRKVLWLHTDSATAVLIDSTDGQSVNHVSFKNAQCCCKMHLLTNFHCIQCGIVAHFKINFLNELIYLVVSSSTII